MIPFKQDDPFTNPEAAARELIRIMKAEMETKERSFAYVGTVNSAFISASSVKSYSAAGILASPKIGSRSFARLRVSSNA